MKQRWTRIVLVAATLVVLVAVNASIFAKEHIRSTGERIYLELAPVDPRSLMQGDYMALRFALASQIEAGGDGMASVTVDERGVATHDPTGQGKLRLRYRTRQGQVWLGTNAWFFEEGSATRLSDARYGEFRVDRDSGEAVLVGLRDIDLAPL